jgi:hypothetical protein
MTSTEQKIRETLFAAGVEVSDHLRVLELNIQNDVNSVQSEADVYGNTYTQLEIVGRKITVVFYTTEV